jgi:hypothetical protein
MKIRKLGWISRGMYLRMMTEAGGQHGDEERMLKKNMRYVTFIFKPFIEYEQRCDAPV